MEQEAQQHHTFGGHGADTSSSSRVQGLSSGAPGSPPAVLAAPAAAALREYALLGASKGAGGSSDGRLRMGESLRRGSTGVNIQGSGFSFSMVEPLKVRGR